MLALLDECVSRTAHLQAIWPEAFLQRSLLDNLGLHRWLADLEFDERDDRFVFSFLKSAHYTMKRRPVRWLEQVVLNVARDFPDVNASS